MGDGLPSEAMELAAPCAMEELKQEREHALTLRLRMVARIVMDPQHSLQAAIQTLAVGYL